MCFAISNSLQKLDLPQAACIAIIGKTTVQYIMSMLGIINSPHHVLAINYKLPKDKVEFCLRDSNVQFIFCDPKFQHLVPNDIPSMQFGDEFEQFLDYTPAAPREWDNNKLSLILNTSGSTGFPKKVTQNYGDFYQVIKSRAVISPSPTHTTNRVMHGALMFHNAGVFRTFYELYEGAEQFIRRSFNARQFLLDMSKYHINSIAVVTPMMAMMLQQKDLVETLNFNAMNKVFLQGAYGDVTMWKRVREVFPNLTVLMNTYGMTETGSTLFGFHPDGIPIPMGSAGYLQPRWDVKLIDSVMHIKTENLLTNYRDQIKEEYFNTNDMFTVDQNGFYYYLGRGDDMFKCGGEKVYPTEVESVLNRHSAIGFSVVVGVADDIKGHKPYAFVKLHSGAGATEEELIQYAANNLATYQIPKRIWFIDNIPMNTVGKTDRLNLKSRANELRAAE
jgi:acyl-CoA synthetase (AMP-forming)/AMP-acid ligase II